MSTNADPCKHLHIVFPAPTGESKTAGVCQHCGGTVVRNSYWEPDRLSNSVPYRWGKVKVAK